MPEGKGKTPPLIAEKHLQTEESGFRALFTKLRKRRIIETLAAFIGGGWLLVEVVERLLVGHYKFPDDTIDLTVVSVIGALLATLVWRWFRSTEKRPGNVKVEVLLVPLIILSTTAIDLNLVLQIAGLPGNTLLIGIAALCLGIVWVILKLSQWAAAAPAISAEIVQAPAGSPIPSPAVPEKSVVVLPFADLSPQKDQDYFCDGVTEEIITDLSHVRDLLVISRNSAMTFKGTQKKTGDIAKEVKVRYVLEGSVRKAGNDLRITAQMIDAMNDSHVWAEKYTGTLDDVFDIQEKVSRSIVNALKVKLEPEESRKMSQRPIDDITAYECYLRAHQEFWRFDEKALDQSLRYLQNALDIVGDNAILFSTMGFAYWHYVNIGLKQDEYIDKAETYVKKALALDPDCSHAHAIMGMIHNSFLGNQKEAFRHYRKALAANPDEVLALLGLAVGLSIMGKKGAALPFAQRYIQLDPLSVPAKFIQGGLYFYDGQYEMALEPFRRFYQLYPDNPAPHLYYAWTLASTGHIKEAFSIVDAGAQAAPDDVMTKMSRMLEYGLSNDREKVARELTPDLRKTCQRDLEWSHAVAVFLAIADFKTEALDWLENAIDRGFINYPLLEREPFLANIRGEERFKKLMERVKYEWEHFEE